MLLVVWNGLSFAQYRLGLVNRSEALMVREMTLDRLMLPYHVVQRLSDHQPPPEQQR
jgi:hypothetical protein